MSRTKQINITIPQEHLDTLEQFDALCKQQGLGRSGAMLQLMVNAVNGQTLPVAQDLELAPVIKLIELMAKAVEEIDTSSPDEQEAPKDYEVPSFLR